MQDKSVNADSRPVDHVAAGAIDNPVVNANPIVNAGPVVSAGPIVNADIAGGASSVIGGSPIVQPPEEEFQEYMSAGCAAVVPAGARKIYLIMVTVTMLVGGAIVYGLFKLLDL